MDTQDRKEPDPDGEMVQVCPVCGSLEVHVSRENVTDLLGMEHEYACHNCGFTGKLFPEVPVERLEEYEQAFESEFPDRFMHPQQPQAASQEPDRRRLLLGALLVLFGAASIGIYTPRILNPFSAAIGIVVAGIALIAYELRR